ncbi:MAG: ABC transporter permease subunit [Thermogemmatispora sp.]|uniref:ABC transporter permease n=1 Tax=Thermogemmatispora sp. TaxID=1968838 RepID=UPI002638E798|nr:ABC transporter permease subunit [Thermogemmatispora sp.]MBX5458464.1 ABC transporter permease subunit [Thermogemmatispora sp.]
MARKLHVFPQQRESRRGLSGSAVYRWLWLRDLILGGSFLFLLCAWLVLAASRWAAPLTPVVAISLSPLALPLYAGYSLLRMLLAYGLALLFTLLYGHVAATNRQAERVLIPLLDLLQSIPILSFLPAVVLALVAAFPRSNLGLELASILLIFTSQAWNMTFSFYHSVLTLPRDLVDVCRLLRLRPWQRFLKLELAAATIGLVWNSMMSWAGGWFFLMASEQFSLGDRSFRLPGLGSYLQLAADRGDPWALTLGLLTLIGLIVLLDVCLWRPLVAWAERFTLEEQAEAAPPRSLVLDLLRASPALHWLRQHVGQPFWEAVAQLLNRLQPQPAGTSALLPGLQPAHHERPRSWLRRGGALLILGLLGLLALWVCWQGGQLLVQVPPATWGRLVLAAGVTWLRTLAALALGTLWTVPVGVAIGLSPRWSRRLQPLVQIVASIPATALFPALLVLLMALPGSLSLAAILLMLLGTQWYVLFNVIAGAMAIPRELLEAAALFGVTGWRRWRTLILPAIFPYLVTGLLTASGGAWNASIVSELVQFHGETLRTFGLGAEIAAAAGAGNYPVLLAGTLLMAALVVLLNRLVWRRLYHLAERRYRLA